MARWWKTAGTTAALILALLCGAAAGEGRPGGTTTDLWLRSKLLGDMGGLRPALARFGISFGLQETDEVWDNMIGGLRRGGDYDGLTSMRLGLDTGKVFGWKGGKFNASALQIHGRSISADRLEELHPISSIEADRTTRLWELWYQQTFFRGKADVRLGQQSIDQEFDLSQYAGVFLNAGFGWAVLPTVDLYASGPVYPLSSLGIRLRAHVTPRLTALGGVFDDNPPGGLFADDSQLRDGEASGTRFNLGTGALWIGEIQYAVNGSPAKRCNDVLCGLSATYKLGGWYDSGGFPDQHLGADGLSLANPASNRMARIHRGNYGVYAVMDQMVWRAGTESPRSIGVFFRLETAPSDRNLVDASLDAGVTLQAPFTDRDNDIFGIVYGYARISGAAAQLDRDTRFFTGRPYPVRSNEALIEITYRAQLAPWWILQPDFQYVFNPGGSLADPHETSRRIGDEAVLGLRSVVTF